MECATRAVGGEMAGTEMRYFLAPGLRLSDYDTTCDPSSYADAGDGSQARDASKAGEDRDAFPGAGSCSGAGKARELAGSSRDADGESRP